MKEILFYAVIFLSNVIQGITGFAGTVIAMPFSIRLVGAGTAAAVLNVLGLLAGVYVLAGNARYVRWKELGRILLFMGPALAAGIALKRILSFDPRILYVTLGVIVTAFGLYNLCRLLYDKKARERAAEEPAGEETDPGATQLAGREDPDLAAAEPAAGEDLRLTLPGALTLIAAGVVHGMYVCGGPLLVGYLTKRLPERREFRATVSVVWIVLNGLILASQLAGGEWNRETLRIQLIALPVLAAAMYVGSLLFKRMDRRFFLILSYVLLIVAGASLFFK